MINNTQPPFPVKGFLPDETYIGNVEIIIKRQKQPRIDPFTNKPFSFGPSMGMMNIFYHAVNEHMFGRSSGTEMLLIKKNEEQTKGALTYCYKVRELPLISFFYLMAMLCQAYYANDPIRSVEIKPTKMTDKTIGLDELWSFSRDLPSFMPVPFQLDIDEDLFDNDTFEVSISFEKKLSKVELEKVKSGLAVWDEMRIVGGFLLNFSDQEEPGNPSSIAHHSPKLVKLESMDFFEGARSALNCVINNAFKLKSEGLQVAGLSFE